MGCINSRHASTFNPIASHAHQRITTDLASPSPLRQDVRFAVAGTVEEWRTFSQLQALHAHAAELLRHIETFMINEPELEPIHRNVLDLYNDLGERTLYFEGDSPSRFQARMNQILASMEGRVPPLENYRQSQPSSPEIESHTPSNASSPSIHLPSPLPR